MRAHSVLCESLTFGDISVHGPNRMDNLLKAHTELAPDFALSDRWIAEPSSRARTEAVQRQPVGERTPRRKRAGGTGSRSSERRAPRWTDRACGRHQPRQHRWMVRLVRIPPKRSSRNHESTVAASPARGWPMSRTRSSRTGKRGTLRRSNWPQAPTNQSEVTNMPLRSSWPRLGYVPRVAPGVGGFPPSASCTHPCLFFNGVLLMLGFGSTR